MGLLVIQMRNKCRYKTYLLNNLPLLRPVCRTVYHTIVININVQQIN